MERRNSKQISGCRGVSHTGVCGRLRIWPGTCREPNDRTRVGAYCIRPSNVPAREQKTLWPNLFRSDSDNRFLPETSKRRMQYAPTPVHPTYFSTPTCTRLTSPASVRPRSSFASFLVSRQEKKILKARKKTPILGIDHSFPTENTQGAYAIRPYSLPADGFRIPPHDIARNPAGFGLCHTT